MQHVVFTSVVCATNCSSITHVYCKEELQTDWLPISGIYSS